MEEGRTVKPPHSPPPAPQERGLSSSTVHPSQQSLQERVPAWVEYDRKVLRFYAYFRESVTESNLESFRLRKCVIYHYLEDQTLHITEPKQQNSGIPQGEFLKKHRVPKDDGTHFGALDFNVGMDVHIYGRTFHVYDCDGFTRNFLSKHGLEVPSGEPVPDEPIEQTQRAQQKPKGSLGPPKPRFDDLTRYNEAKLGRASNILKPDTLKQFLENDGKVLRFFCLFDDRDSLYGERRPYILHYFLADDTIEVLEVNETNSGRDPVPTFLKRMRVPRETPKADALGPTKTEDHITYRDLSVGGTINILGREFLIHNCDQFTQNWYMRNLGYTEDDFKLLDIYEPAPEIPQNELPPYNGVGSYEDSLQNCISVVPTPPRKDFQKLFNYQHKALRFVCRFVEDNVHVLTPAERDRKFILSYYLYDDTVSMYEPEQRNSGIVSGKFLERGVVRKPGSWKAYQAHDFYVGAVVEINNRWFEVSEADDYTYKMMEENPQQFPRSDPKRVLQKLKENVTGKLDDLRSACIDMDVTGGGLLRQNELFEALKTIGAELEKQEVITIVRHFDEHGDGRIAIERLLDSISE